MRSLAPPFWARLAFLHAIKSVSRSRLALALAETIHRLERRQDEAKEHHGQHHEDEDEAEHEAEFHGHPQRLGRERSAHYEPMVMPVKGTSPGSERSSPSSSPIRGG